MSNEAKPGVAQNLKKLQARLDDNKTGLNAKLNKNELEQAVNVLQAFKDLIALVNTHKIALNGDGTANNTGLVKEFAARMQAIEDKFKNGTGKGSDFISEVKKLITDMANKVSQADFDTLNKQVMGDDKTGTTNGLLHTATTHGQDITTLRIDVDKKADNAEFTALKDTTVPAVTQRVQDLEDKKLLPTASLLTELKAISSLKTELNL